MKPIDSIPTGIALLSALRAVCCELSSHLSWASSLLPCEPLGVKKTNFLLEDNKEELSCAIATEGIEEHKEPPRFWTGEGKKKYKKMKD